MIINAGVRQAKLAVIEAELTAAEIAGAIRRPAKLQAAESSWRALVQRSEQLNEEIRGLIAQRRAATTTR